jgi:hypothetical protein
MLLRQVAELGKELTDVAACSMPAASVVARLPTGKLSASCAKCTLLLEITTVDEVSRLLYKRGTVDFANPKCTGLLGVSLTATVWFAEDEKRHFGQRMKW